MDFAALLNPAAVQVAATNANARVQEARKGLPEPKDVRVSLTQIGFERANLQSLPTPHQMVGLLQQHDPVDVKRIVNVAIFALRSGVYSPQWYLFRFAKMNRAAKRIRRAWSSSRLRFLVKMARLVVRWNRLELSAKRANGPQRSAEKTQSAAQTGLRGAAKRRQEADEQWTRELLTVTAPAPLKKKVMVVQYKRLMAELQRRWREWRIEQVKYDAAVRSLSLLAPEQQKRAAAKLKVPDAEPCLDWYALLSSLTHSQLFELSLRVQTEARGHETSSKPTNGVYANPVDEFCSGRRSLDGASFGIDITAIDQYAKSDEAKEWDRLRHSKANPYEYVASRIFDHHDQQMSDPADPTVAGRIASRNEARITQTAKGGGVRLSGVGELRSMRTLARFKGDPWTTPARQVPALRDKPFQTRCDPPSFSGLDAFTKSLATRGVTGAPRTRDSDKQHRRAEGLEQVSYELPDLKATYCSVSDLLRSRKALEITLNLPPSKLHGTKERSSSTQPSGGNVNGRSSVLTIPDKGWSPSASPKAAQNPGRANMRSRSAGGRRR